MFLQSPTSKQFDDAEWIRSLTEVREITADVPEDSVMYDQQAVDLKKSPANAEQRLAAAPRAQ